MGFKQVKKIKNYTKNLNIRTRKERNKTTIISKKKLDKKKLPKLNMHNNNNENNTYNIKLTDSRNIFSQKIKISRLGKCNRYDIMYFGDNIKIPYGKKYILNTNIGIEVPENILGIISNHSETYNHSWQLVTGPIIIDSDFCGEIVLEIPNTDGRWPK